MLDRGIGEEAFDIPPPVQHEGGEDQRGQPQGHHQGARRDHLRIGGEQQLEAQNRIKRDIEKETRQHGRDRCRTFGMGIRQPGM